MSTPWFKLGFAVSAAAVTAAVAYYWEKNKSGEDKGDEEAVPSTDVFPVAESVAEEDEDLKKPSTDESGTLSQANVGEQGEKDLRTLPTEESGTHQDEAVSIPLIEEKSSKAPDAHDMLPTEDSGIHKEDDAVVIPLSKSNIDELAPKDMTKLPVGSGIRKDDDVANIPSIEETFDKEIQVDLTIPTIDDAVIIPLIEDTAPKLQDDNEAIIPTDESGSHKEDDAVVTPLSESNVDEQQSEENVASSLEKGGPTVRDEATIELSIEDVLREDPEMSKYMCWGSFLDNKPSVKDSSKKDCTVEPTTEAEATKVDAETSRFLTEAVQRQEDVEPTILEIKSDSPVPQASSSSTVRNEADPPPSIHVSGVTKEDSFIQRFIECRENSSSAKRGIRDSLLATTQNHSAKKDMILFTTLIYPVNRYHLFRIEGHQGKVRDGLCKDYDVKIKIHKEQAKVSIIGKKERCEEALVAIKEIVFRQEKLIASFESDWDVKV